MEYRRFGTKFAVRIDPGEEILEQLELLSPETGLKLYEF